MTYPKKETNEVRMLGVLPSEGAAPIPVGKIPDLGTQVAVNNAVAGNTITVHTVTVGGLYLSLAIVAFRNDSADTVHIGRLFVTNASDVTQYYIYDSGILAASQHFLIIPFSPPLEIPNGYKVKIYSGSADLATVGFIHGYEA